MIYIAAAGGLLAAASLIISLIAYLAARRSAIAAESSADSSRRSATAAEESLLLQRAEFEALSAQRQTDQTCRVVPLKWDGTVNAPYRGLVIQNAGRGSAHDIVGLVMSAGGVKKGIRALLVAGDRGEVFPMATYAPDTDELRNAPTSVKTGKLFARLTWVNDDKTAGLADWAPLQNAQ